MKSGRTAAAKGFFVDTMSSKTVRGFAMQAVYFFAGILVSGGAVFGSYAPFGASMTAAVPFKNLLSSIAGVSLGYILFTPGGSFRYVATVLAIGAIRWTLSDLKKINASRFFAPVVAFIPMLATGLVLAAVGDFAGSLVAMCVIEALLAAVGGYFFSRSIALSTGTRGITTFNQQEIACIVMTACILLLAFSGISVAGISLGRVLAVLAILFCARYGAVAGGCISGVATGVIFSMADSSLSFVAGSYAFGGLMAGLFAPTGKIGTILAFLACNTVMAFQSESTSLILTSVYETLIASFVFFVLPKDLGNQLSSVFSPPVDKARAEGLRRNVIMRLDFAAKALSDVSAAVDNVAKKMKEIFSSDVSSIYAKATEETCSHCGLRVYCWEKQREASLNDFNNLTELLRKKGRIEEKDFSARFAKKCCKAKEMAAAINKNYDAYTACLSAERRVGEIRSVVAGQFSGLSEILEEMAEEFENYERFDMAAAERVSTAVKLFGITPIDVSCRIDRFGRMTVEIETVDTNRNHVKKPQLLKEISKACGRRLDTPCLSLAPNRCRMQMSKRPCFDTQIGSAQHISGNGQLCGDSYNYFNDGMGRLIAVISDGMGTGGRAAVDGSMAESIMTKLTKAGLGFDCALRVVNSALMVKSGDESLATLDVVCIDLFTGHAEIMKAGAPLSIIKKNGKTYRCNGASLPAGILTDIRFSHDSAKLGLNDWLCMVSDGAIATGDMWLESLIQDWKDGSAQELAKAIVTEARNRRTDGYDDDITAVAIRLMRN